SHFDFYFRDPANPDVRSVDHLIDELVARGRVDPNRISVMGWSNGAFFAAYYAMLRHDRPTPGGARIAAAVPFAGGNPFSNVKPSENPSCQSAVPRTALPVLLIHRDCDDLVGCSPAQSREAPPGFDVETWADLLRTSGGDGSVVDLIVDRDGRKVGSCQA